MQEELISYETAKLAKEKGFDWECCYVIHSGGSLEPQSRHGKPIKNSQLVLHFVTSPTQSLLQKWLRERSEGRILVFVMPVDDWNHFYYKIYNIYK